MRSTVATLQPGGSKCLADLRPTQNILGGYERMLSKHMQLGITEEQRFRFASLMSLAAGDAGMPGVSSSERLAREGALLLG